MDLREYEQHKFAIAEVLRQTSLASPDQREWRERTTNLFARLADDRFNLVVVGRFSRGKTSLMNAMLGTDRLPMGIVPLTSVITTVAYGSAEHVVLRYYERRFLEQEIPRSEFLLRMCDRVAELARALPHSDGAVSLADEIAALSRRIAGDNPSALQIGFPKEEASRGPTAVHLRPCEICASVSSALWEFARHFQYETTVNREARRDLAERGGLCSFHTWQYESIASPQGICEGYSAVLEDWATWMHSAASDAPTDSVIAKLRARVPSESSCLLCQVRARAELEAITALTRRFADDETQAFDRMSALCLSHFAALAAGIQNTRVIRELMRRQASLLERLAEDMKRYALKRDGTRSSLLSDEEEAASKRGLSIMARGRNIADRIG